MNRSYISKTTYSQVLKTVRPPGFNVLNKTRAWQCPNVHYNHMFKRETYDKLPKCIFCNLKILKNHKGDLSQKSPETNMWLLVNHTKLTNTLC